MHVRKIVKLIAATFLAVALAASADEPPKASTSDLVEAARAAKPRRAGSKTKVITNADVKRAAAKGQPGGKGVAPAAGKPVTNPIREHQASLKAKADAEARLKKLEEKVATLETELTAIEHRYYDEDDLDRRDNVIKREFELKKTELAVARRDLQTVRADAGVPTS